MSSSDSEWVERLATSIRGIAEPKQRIQKLLEWIKTKDGENAALVLQEICTKSKQPGSPLALLHLDMIRYRTLTDALEYEKLKETYAAALRLNFPEVVSLLRSDRTVGFQDEHKPESFARKLDALTVGARKQLSRNLSKQKLEFLLFDNDAKVIRELLQNPKMTERDVVRIAARHQAPTAVLEEILKSDRWMSQYRVRKALAFNPSTPRSCLSGLLNHLRKKDLQLLLGSGVCDEELADRIRTFLRPA